MKKLFLLLGIMLILSGCGPQDYETMNDVYSPQTPAEPMQVSLSLPEDASKQVVESDTGCIYFCDGYEITLETMAAGDLNATLLALTGFQRDALTVMETETDGIKRYECVWTAAGESGDQVHRSVILDDGTYHYSLCVMALAQDAGSLQESWQELLGSFCLIQS